MKIVKRCLFLGLFLMLAIVTNAQDEIYNEKYKQEIVVDTSNSSINEKDIHNYVTEADYYAQQQKKQKNSEVFTEDDTKEKRRDNSEAVQIAAEVVLEVFIHAVFIIAAIWN